MIFRPFQEVTLLEARDARDDVRRMLRKGKDPALIEQLRKLARTMPAKDIFEQVVRA